MYQINDSVLKLYKSPVIPAGLTTSNHLSEAYLTEPEMIESVMAYAMGKSSKKGILNMITGGTNNIHYVNDRQYTWFLHAQTDRAIEVTGNFSDGGSVPGISASTFRVKMAEKWFSYGDILVSDNGTQVRVQREPAQDGLDFVYTLQLTEPDLTRFIDPTQIAAGAKFSKDFSAYSEYEIKGGSTNYVAPFPLRNQLNLLRKSYKVTRSAATDVMIIELPHPEDPNTKTKLWTKYSEWNALVQWQEEIERSYLYSTLSKDTTLNLGENYLKSENGNTVYLGAGLRQQIIPANKYYYTESLSYDFLNNVLLDLSYMTDEYGGNGSYTILTGKVGKQIFSDAITEKFKGLNVIITNEGKFISGTGNELKFEGDQFVTANFPNGITVTVVEMPMYDNLARNGRNLIATGKYAGKPKESARMTIIPNDGEGKPGIKKVAKKDSMNAMWHVAGSTSPFDGVAKAASTQRSSGIDGYEVHMLAECGLLLVNPAGCAEVICI
jgi:hypothetical protein